MAKLEPPALLEKASEVIRSVDPGALIETIEFRDEVTLVVDKRPIVAIIRALREKPELRFDFLSDITAIDYLEMERDPRFDVVYHLFSLEHHHRLRLRAPVEEAEAQCRIDTITGLWTTANYHEREVYDMYGIRFDGHPDLRRILMPENWKGHPLRKDFPIGGSTSFYFKQDTDEYAGEPEDLVPRIHVQDSDV